MQKHTWKCPNFLWFACVCVCGDDPLCAVMCCDSVVMAAWSCRGDAHTGNGNTVFFMWHRGAAIYSDNDNAKRQRQAGETGHTHTHIRGLCVLWALQVYVYIPIFSPNFNYHETIYLHLNPYPRVNLTLAVILTPSSQSCLHKDERSPQLYCFSTVPTSVAIPETHTHGVVPAHLIISSQFFFLRIFLIFFLHIFIWTDKAFLYKIFFVFFTVLLYMRWWLLDLPLVKYSHLNKYFLPAQKCIYILCSICCTARANLK